MLLYEQYFVQTDADLVKTDYWLFSSDNQREDKIQDLNNKIQGLTDKLELLQNKLDQTILYSNTHIDSLTTYVRALEEGQALCRKFIEDHDREWYLQNT